LVDKGLPANIPPRAKELLQRAIRASREPDALLSLQDSSGGSRDSLTEQFEGCSLPDPQIVLSWVSLLRFANWLEMDHLTVRQAGRFAGLPEAKAQIGACKELGLSPTELRSRSNGAFQEASEGFIFELGEKRRTNRLNEARAWATRIAVATSMTILAMFGDMLNPDDHPLSTSVQTTYEVQAIA
jgi:hypothetical protein